MIYLIFILALAALAFWMLGGRELIGEAVASIFPKDPIKKGDQVDVFLDGKHNRNATITSILADKLIIYDSFPLPIDFRGRFYATGVSQDDGSKLVYVKTRKYYKFVRLAELIKKAFNLLDDPNNLMPDQQGDVPVASEQNNEEKEDEQ